MVIGFKKQFVEKILSGEKRQTIRKDVHNRYKPGVTLHCATGVRTKAYKQFYTTTVIDTKKIEIDPARKLVKIETGLGGMLSLGPASIEQLARLDGFDKVEDFWAWFSEPMKGKIIYYE